jgi:hypothetical protein
MEMGEALMELNTDVGGDSHAVDMVLVLSSELVCQIAEKYFNSTMLKKKVKVIDLQATSNGLVQFNVAFEPDAKKVDIYVSAPGAAPVKVEPLQRGPNGQFKKAKA